MNNGQSLKENRSLTHKHCSNQPRIIRTWSVTVIFLIFAHVPFLQLRVSQPDKVANASQTNHRGHFASLSLTPVFSCQQPLLKASLKTFPFPYYRAFPLPYPLLSLPNADDDVWLLCYSKL